MDNNHDALPDDLDIVLANFSIFDAAPQRRFIRAESVDAKIAPPPHHQEQLKANETAWCQDKAKRVTLALRKLPHSAVSDELLVSIGIELARSSFVPRPSFEPPDLLPRFKNASLAETRKQVEAVKEQAMNRPAIEQISLPGPSDWRHHLKGQLGDLEWEADNLSLFIESITKNGGQGRKKNEDRLFLMVAIADYYSDITGKRPTLITDPDTGVSRGPFLDLVREIFSIFEIQDSPLSRAREAICNFGCYPHPPGAP